MREPPKVTVHDLAVYSDNGTSSGKPPQTQSIWPPGRVRTDHEPPDDYESARADSRGLAEDDALRQALGSVALHVERGLELVLGDLLETK